MKLLLDTHILLWAAGDSPRLSTTAKDLIEDRGNSLVFSVASIWEVVVKHMLGRADFRADPAKLRASLLANGYAEVSIASAPSAHTLAIRQLPSIHKDPFDRMLVAQTIAEEATLVTADSTVSRYPASIVLV